MQTKFLATVIVAQLFSCSSEQNDSGVQSIYGSDDRRDIYDQPEQRWTGFSRSIAALVKQDKISGNRLVAETLGKKLNLCETERFRDQPSAAGCSGSMFSICWIFFALNNWPQKAEPLGGKSTLLAIATPGSHVKTMKSSE